MTSAPHVAPAVGVLALVLVACTAWVGWVLVQRSGPDLWPVGLIGLALVVLYTGPINRSVWACLIAPGLGFGVLMVLGTVLVLGGQWNADVWMSIVPPFLLVNGLLLLNQFPDEQADREAGRRHIVVMLGRVVAGRVFGVMVFGAFLWIALLGLVGIMPVTTLIALVPLPLAVLVVRTAAGPQPEKLPQDRLVQAMGRNVFVTLSTPALMAALMAAGIALAGMVDSQ